jgi:hypothetical protein
MDGQRLKGIGKKWELERVREEECMRERRGCSTHVNGQSVYHHDAMPSSAHRIELCRGYCLPRVSLHYQ